MSPYFVTGVDDPTKKSVYAPQGAIYARVGNLGGALYQKQDDGDSVNWKIVGSMELNLGEDGEIDLSQILAKKENIGVAFQLTSALEAKLTRSLNGQLAESQAIIAKQISDAVSQMNTAIETNVAQNIANKIQNYFTEKDKDFNAQVASIKSTLEKSLFEVLTSKINDMGGSITNSVAQSVNATSAAARADLVIMFKEKIAQQYLLFKQELNNSTDSKIKTTFDEIYAAATKSARDSYSVLEATIKAQSDEFKAKSDAFLGQAGVNYDVINDYLAQFENTLKNKVTSEVTQFFDTSKKDFSDNLKTEFNLAINKAVQELQIYINSRSIQ